MTRTRPPGRVLAWRARHNVRQAPRKLPGPARHARTTKNPAAMTTSRVSRHRRKPSELLAIPSERRGLTGSGWISARNVWRREGDSNPRYPLGVYTLSRRASSTTRAPLLISLLKASTHWKAPQRYNNICILPNCHVFSSRLGYLWQTLPKGALMGVVVDSTEQDCVNQYRSAG